MSVTQILTLVGLVFVAIGISYTTRALFLTHKEHGRGPVFRSAWRTGRFIARQYRRLRPGKPITVEIGTVYETSTVFPIRAVQGGPGFSDDARLDEQLVGLKKWVERVEAEVTNVRNEQKVHYQEVRAEISKHTTSLRHEDQAIRALVREAVASTLRLQITGLIWVGAGTALMALPAIFTV